MEAKSQYAYYQKLNTLDGSITSKITFALQQQKDYDQDPNRRLGNVPHSKSKSSTTIVEPFFIDKEFTKRKKNNEYQCALIKLYDKKDRADFKLVINQSTIMAHSYILIARCEYFSALFDSQLMKEKSSEVSATDAKSFEKFLRYIYTGDSSKIDLSQIGQLLAWMDYYQLRSQQLKYLSQSQISESQLNDENIMGFAQMADNMHLQNVMDKCINYLVRNFLTLKKHPLSTLSSDFLSKVIIERAKFECSQGSPKAEQSPIN